MSVQIRNRRGEACWIPKNVCDTIIRLRSRRIICTDDVVLRDFFHVAECKVYSCYELKQRKKKMNLGYEKVTNGGIV